MGKSVTTLICPVCGKEFVKEIAEIRRRQKKCGIDVQFYCSASCSGKGVGERIRKPTVIKICPTCGKEFESTTKAKAATFCSRSCASKGSVNEARREAGRKAAAANFIYDLSQIQYALLTRDGWKYVELDKYLNSINEPHEFEYILGKYHEHARIYDLALTERKILIEFDEPHHRYTEDDDGLKDEHARKYGFEVKRIQIDTHTVIDPSCIYEFLK